MHVSQGFPQGFGDRGGQIRGGGDKSASTGGTTIFSPRATRAEKNHIIMTFFKQFKVKQHLF